MTYLPVTGASSERNLNVRLSLLSVCVLLAATGTIGGILYGVQRVREGVACGAGLGVRAGRRAYSCCRAAALTES